MVSGIGPAATLAQFKVPVLSDLQGVGQNLQVRGNTCESFDVSQTGAGSTVLRPVLSSQRDDSIAAE